MDKEKRYLKIYFTILFVGITLLMAGSLLWDIREEYHTIREYATIEAKASYNKDLLYRRWAAMHGGVYVQVTDSLKPNSYLQFIDDRDIVSDKGKQLTLINPAYMTRQVLAIAEDQYGVKGHITSLNPIRPENSADEWEKNALELFEKGEKEHRSLEKLNGEEYLRYMLPMMVEESCLKCHSHQGYKLGQIRGGISVSVPMAKYDIISLSRIKLHITNHSLIYIVFVLFSGLSYRGILSEIRKRVLMQSKVVENQAALEKQNREYAILNQEYRNQNQELLLAKSLAEENDKLKTAFLQNMSHEIRTPLNAICGFSDILSKPSLAPEKHDKFISIIRNSSMQLLSIVSNVLTMSALETKQEKISVDKVCINGLIRELHTIFSQQADENRLLLKSRLNLKDWESEIYTDKTKVTQILTNLLSNALKFTHEGYVETGCTLKEKELEFYVKDTGVGIRTELHEKIFERFRQGDVSIRRLYGGTGLGLTISKSFTELLGGRMWVQSEPGKGSVFFFTIPYNPVHEPKAVSDGQKDNSGIILVVENEECNYLLIEEFLAGMDLKLIHAWNGQEAVDACKINPDINLILMDLKMPVMDGNTAAHIIKNFRPKLPIVAQSAYVTDDDSRYSDVFEEYLSKPLSHDKMRKTVMKYIRKTSRQ